MAGSGAIKGGGVQFAERIIRRVGKIDDDEIKTVGVRIDPGESIGVDDMHTRGEEGFVVEFGKHGMGGEELSHFGVEIDEGDAFDLGIFEDFTDGEAVAATEDKNMTRRGNPGEAGMDEGFVIAIFVAGTELQVAV